ncbi:MAG: hypothetical protein MHMPM18_001221 [Marteilia pararefringens]
MIADELEEDWRPLDDFDDSMITKTHDDQLCESETTKLPDQVARTNLVDNTRSSQGVSRFSIFKRFDPHFKTRGPIGGLADKSRTIPKPEPLINTSDKRLTFFFNEPVEAPQTASNSNFDGADKQEICYAASKATDVEEKLHGNLSIMHEEDEMENQDKQVEEEDDNCAEEFDIKTFDESNDSHKSTPSPQRNSLEVERQNSPHKLSSTHFDKKSATNVPSDEDESHFVEPSNKSILIAPVSPSRTQNTLREKNNQDNASTSSPGIQNRDIIPCFTKRDFYQLLHEYKLSLMGDFEEHKGELRLKHKSLVENSNKLNNLCSAAIDENIRPFHCSLLSQTNPTFPQCTVLYQALPVLGASSGHNADVTKNFLFSGQSNNPSSSRSASGVAQSLNSSECSTIGLSGNSSSSAETDIDSAAVETFCQARQRLLSLRNASDCYNDQVSKMRPLLDAYEQLIEKQKDAKQECLEAEQKLLKLCQRYELRQAQNVGELDGLNKTLNRLNEEADSYVKREEKMLKFNDFEAEQTNQRVKDLESDLKELKQRMESLKE